MKDIISLQHQKHIAYFARNEDDGWVASHLYVERSAYVIMWADWQAGSFVRRSIGIKFKLNEYIWDWKGRKQEINCCSIRGWG